LLTADTINGFSASLLQKNFDGAVESPACHIEWWELCTQPRSPLVAIAAPRNHAKSTAISFAYTLACVLFRERQYVLLVSDTVTQAVQFLGDIKRELADNEQIKQLFAIKEFIKEADDDIIVLCEDGHKFRIQAKGSEQKVRGLKWNNKRPDLIVCDDLENDEIVMNKERREKFRKWFYGALLPCRSVDGIVRFVGTILHADSLLERLMPKPYDKKNTRFNELKTFSTKRIAGWESVKYKAHNEDFTAFLWKSKFDRAAEKEGLSGAKQYFISLRQGFLDQGLPESYSQEYLNIPIDESVSYFRRADFLPSTEEDKKRTCHYYITADLAVSKEDYADYSVFLVARVDEDRTIYIHDIIKDRLDGREIVDMVINLEKIYKPEVFGIEKMQVSQAIGPFLREEMVRQDVWPNLMQLEHQGKDKVARGRSIQARMRAQTVKFNKGKEWYPDFENELMSFPRGKHDDQVDSFAYLGMLLDKVLEAPTQQELAAEEYFDEYDRNHGPSGRSSVTGY
jgi:predicted phage terminase large subunit-like protein